MTCLEENYFKDFFMVLQPKIIVCENSTAPVAMVLRFLPLPAVMLATSMAVRLQRTLLHAKRQCIICNRVTFLCAQAGVSALGVSWLHKTMMTLCVMNIY